MSAYAKLGPKTAEFENQVRPSLLVQVRSRRPTVLQLLCIMGENVKIHPSDDYDYDSWHSGDRLVIIQCFLFVIFFFFIFLFFYLFIFSFFSFLFAGVELFNLFDHADPRLTYAYIPTLHWITDRHHRRDPSWYPNCSQLSVIQPTSALIAEADLMEDVRSHICTAWKCQLHINVSGKARSTYHIIP